MIPTAQPGPSLQSQRANISSTLAANPELLAAGHSSASKGVTVPSNVTKRTGPNRRLSRQQAGMLLLLDSLTFRRHPGTSYRPPRRANGGSYSLCTGRAGNPAEPSLVFTATTETVE